jgi:hypothetical protein
MCERFQWQLAAKNQRQRSVEAMSIPRARAYGLTPTLLDLARDERDQNRGAEELWKTEVDEPGAKPCAGGPLVTGGGEGAGNGAGIFCTLGLGKFRICALAGARGAAARTSAAMKRARGCMENSCSFAHC